MHACDGGQTDGQTEFLSLDRVCIACSAVKIRAHVVREGLYFYTLFSILNAETVTNRFFCIVFY